MMPGWLEVVIRSFVSIFVIIFGSKLFVRKTIGELSQLEFIITTAVAVIVAVGSVSLSIPPAFLILALFIWFFIPFFVRLLSLKSLTFRKIVFGKPVPVVENGKILEDELKKQRYSTDDFLSKLRAKNVFQVSDVEFAVLEPDGNLNVLVKNESQPLTPKNLGIKVANEKPPQVVISDGIIFDESLAKIGLNRRWLMTELEKLGVALENVFLGQVNSYGELTVDLYDDKLQVTEPIERSLLLATMKKVQADFESFSLETNNERAKNLYQRLAKEIETMIERLKPYLH